MACLVWGDKDVSLCCDGGGLVDDGLERRAVAGAPITGGYCRGLARQQACAVAADLLQPHAVGGSADDLPHASLLLAVVLPSQREAPAHGVGLAGRGIGIEPGGSVGGVLHRGSHRGSGGGLDDASSDKGGPDERGSKDGRAGEPSLLKRLAHKRVEGHAGAGGRDNAMACEHVHGSSNYCGCPVLTGLVVATVTTPL